MELITVCPGTYAHIMKSGLTHYIDDMSYNIFIFLIYFYLVYWLASITNSSPYCQIRNLTIYSFNSSQLRFGCGVPFILVRSLDNKKKMSEAHRVFAHPTCGLNNEQRTMKFIGLKIPHCLFAKNS